ncbi:MAG: hypothetical protein ACD_54C00662G0005 [uncultured bacterium]|nr:MAG: hypothetical protein ACD_54C00662G0005 [uncultured bacterium]
MSSTSFTHGTPNISLVVPLGSEVPVPPPSAFHCPASNRAMSATTQVPIAK